MIIAVLLIFSNTVIARIVRLVDETVSSSVRAPRLAPSDATDVTRLG